MTPGWGATPVDDGRTRFALWAPDAAGVELEIDGAPALAMTEEDDGWFVATTQAPAGTRYRFRIGDTVVPDPASRAQSGGVHGWSLVIDPAYPWTVTDWRGRPWEETVLVELHPGLLGGFRGVIDQLPAIAATGVTAIELMPVGAFGGTRGWGYDGVLPYAPAEAYGSPADLKALVDAAHGFGLSVFLDVVYNHFGPDGNYLGAYASSFFDPEVHTPWGGAVAVEREAVHRFFVDNALMWLRDYRIDGLRFDAVHAIADDAFLDAMATEIREALPDRHIHLVLENERNDAARLRDGGYDAQWNDDFHNVLHVLLTGETSAYYSDFAQDPTAKLARCLGEGFIYQGDTTRHGHARGEPSGGLPPTAFVAFLQNHDQIGNRALGERLHQLCPPQALKAATALLLLSPMIPLMFMGDEANAAEPFLFFTDHHGELAEAVREGRRNEFADFAAFQDPERREHIPDPNALSTLQQSMPTLADQDHVAFYRELLSLRHRHIVPHLPGSVALGAQVLGDAAVSARWRLGNGSVLQIDLNLSATALEHSTAPHLIFATPAGDGTHLPPYSARVTLSPAGEHP